MSGIMQGKMGLGSTPLSKYDRKLHAQIDADMVINGPDIDMAAEHLNKPSAEAYAQIQQVEGTIKQYQQHLSQLKLYSQVTEEAVESETTEEMMHMLEEMEDGSCWLPSKGRAAIGIIDTCDEGFEAAGPMCFQSACPDGYEKAMGHCVEECNDDEIAQGLQCFDAADNNISRQRKDIDLDFAPLRCAEGLEQYGNDCYETCEEGWHGQQNVCYRDTCPDDYELCGTLCEPIDNECND